MFMDYSKNTFILSSAVMATTIADFTPITSLIEKNNWDVSFVKRWRKKKPRAINYTPTLTIRQPIDGIVDSLSVRLEHDELEALRLKYMNKLGIVTAAKQMWISKSLFATIVIQAATKITQALVYWKRLEIELWSTDFEPPLF